MIPKCVDNPTLETIYDTLAEAVDRAPADKRTLFLAKLALGLSNLVADPAKVAAAAEAALRDL